MHGHFNTCTFLYHALFSISKASKRVQSSLVEALWRTLGITLWCAGQAQQREEERVNDIVHRTVEKDEKLATLRDHRDHVNACKSLERKLDLDLKREKVCHSQGLACVVHCNLAATPCSTSTKPCSLDHAPYFHLHSVLPNARP